MVVASNADVLYLSMRSMVLCELFEEAREGKARTGGRSDPVPLSSHLRGLTGKLIGAARGIISRCGEMEPTPHEMRKKQVNWL